MTSQPIDWNTEVTPTPEQEYQALLRTLRWTKGFGLLFIQCSPAKGKELIEAVKQDLPQKRIDVLSLTEPIDNLYDVVDQLPHKHQLDVLFIQGIEHSLYAYENHHLWNDSTEKYGYSEKHLPRLLGHLNLARERLRDHFPICFVFLVPLFALKYLTRRAPDFFDWRSGVLEFTLDQVGVNREYQEVYGKRFDLEDYRNLSPQERREEILRIQALLEEPHQPPHQQANLAFEQGLLYSQAGEYEAAIASYDRTVTINPDQDKAWYNRGLALQKQGRYEEAIASYDQAVAINPEDDSAWYNRGLTWNKLGRYEEAIASYDKALAIKPDNHAVWYNRGFALGKLGRYQEEIASYDRALAIQPDDSTTWNSRGYALFELGNYEKAIISFNEALRIEPSDKVFSNLAAALGQLGHAEETIAYCEKALEINPGNHNAWYDKGVSLTRLSRYDEAIASYDQAVTINPEDDSAWYNRGIILFNLRRYKDAIASLKKALEIRQKVGDRKGEANSLKTLARLAIQSGAILQGFALAQQAIQILQELDLSVAEMLRPGWLKSLLKFAERGTFQKALLVVLAIIVAPFLVVWFLLLMSWRIVSTQWSRHTDNKSI